MTKTLRIRIFCTSQSSKQSSKPDLARKKRAISHFHNLHSSGEYPMVSPTPKIITSLFFSAEKSTITPTPSGNFSIRIYKQNDKLTLERGILKREMSKLFFNYLWSLLTSLESANLEKRRLTLHLNEALEDFLMFVPLCAAVTGKKEEEKTV